MVESGWVGGPDALRTYSSQIETVEGASAVACASQHASPNLLPVATPVAMAMVVVMLIIRGSATKTALAELTATSASRSNGCIVRQSKDSLTRCWPWGICLQRRYTACVLDMLVLVVVTRPHLDTTSPGSLPLRPSLPAGGLRGRGPDETAGRAVQLCRAAVEVARGV